MCVCFPCLTAFVCLAFFVLTRERGRESACVPACVCVCVCVCVCAISLAVSLPHSETLFLTAYLCSRHSNPTFVIFLAVLLLHSKISLVMLYLCNVHFMCLTQTTNVIMVLTSPGSDLITLMLSGQLRGSEHMIQFLERQMHAVGSLCKEHRPFFSSTFFPSSDHTLFKVYQT